MPNITNSVGPGQPNARHDTALVQAMLRLINNSAGRPYLSGRIDGGHGPITQGAIDAFQRDHGGDRVPIAPGVILPGGATIGAMSALLPADRSDLRVLAGQRVVYVGRPLAEATEVAKAIRTNASLRRAFRNRVAQLVETMHTRHGIVLTLTPTGGRRSFAEQARHLPPQSYAGPGESNHNYGNAVDIGFNNTVWFPRNGRTVTDNHWLGQLERYERAAQTAFWDARDAIALHPPINLFRLRFERIHLQDFDDATTSSGRSLAAHLSAVGAWNWRTGHYDRARRDWHYACDLGGAAGVFVEVGTANQIWAGNATVTVAEITRTGWRRPGPAGGAAHRPGAPAPRAGGGGAARPGAPALGAAAAPPVTHADIAVVRRALQADFQAADREWARWTPVP